MSSKSFISRPQQLSSQSPIRKKGSVNSPSQLNQVSPIIKNHISQSPSRNLPSLATNDPAQIASLKQRFEEFSEGVARFSRTAGCSVSFKDTLSTQLTSTSHSFGVFYSFLQRKSSVLFQNRNSNQTNKSPFATSCQNFCDNLIELVKLLISIKESGIKQISESLENNFDKVISNLSVVISNPNPHPSIHDPIVPLAKKLQNELLSYKQIAFSNSEQESPYHLLIELRNFSSELNNAFSNEFTRCRYGLHQNEKVRSISITSCNEILQDTKALIAFKSLLSTSFSNFEIFKEKINAILLNLGFPQIEIQTEKETAVEEEELNEKAQSSPIQKKEIKQSIENNNLNFKLPEINESMTLKKIFGSLYNEITKMNNDKKSTEHFFSVLNIKAHNIETKEITLLNQVSDLQSQYSDISVRLHDVEQQNKVLQQRLKTTTQANDSVDLVACIEYVSCQIREFLNINNDNINFDDSSNKSIMDSVRSLASQLTQYQCKKCNDYENQINQAIDILLFFSTPKNENRNLIELCNIAKHSYLELKGQYSNLNQLLETSEHKADMKLSQLSIIMNEFPNANSHSEDLFNEIVKQIRLERQKHHDDLEKESEKFNTQLENYKLETSKIFSQEFQTDSSKSLQDQIKQLKNNIIHTDKEMSELKDLMNRSIKKLHRYLDTETQENQSILDLIDQLHRHENLNEQENNSISRLNKCQNTIFEILNLPKIAPKQNFSCELDSLTNAIDLISQHIDGIDQNDRKKKAYNIKLRSMLESIDFKLLAFFKSKSLNEVGNVDKIETIDLVLRIGKMVDDIIQSAQHNSKLSKTELDHIFEKVLPMLNPALVQEPIKYLNEICTNYLIYHESFESLNPFAAILNEIVQSFDCKLKSFQPGSNSFTFIRQEVYKMHSTLNQIGPSKVHSLLFLVLSRFVALISSFLSAISSLEYQNEIENA